MPIYLDNAASTRPAREVLDEIARVAEEHFANAASAHALGAAATRCLEQSRESVARALEARPEEIVFTGGGTEADALAVRGVMARARGRHIVISAIEHPAVLRNAQGLAADAGCELTLAPVTPAGVVEPSAVLAAVREDTALVAVMLVNNELGTIQPVAEIARLLAARPGPRARRPHLHVDAVQAFGLVRFRAGALGADSIAVSAHKLHGPKGVGALWLAPGARVAPLWSGGGQERGLRSGTENVAGIAGFARAAELARHALAAGAGERVAGLRDAFEQAAIERVPGARRTLAERGPVAPHIASLAIPDLRAEPLLHALAARDVIAAAGSACASKTRGPSHVLKAIGIGDDTAVLRFSLSRETTAAELDAAVAALGDAVRELG